MWDMFALLALVASGLLVWEAPTLDLTSSTQPTLPPHFTRPLDSRMLV